MKLGKTARYLRERLGLTQREAAQQLGITAVHLCNIEKNKSAPSPDLLSTFQKTFNVDLYILAWCMRGSQSKLPPQVHKATKDLTEAWLNELEETLSREIS